jgi:FkbH-like protein
MEVNICYNFMDELKYFEILNLNNRLKEILSSEHYNISVISNITINQFKEILELPLRKEGINAVVHVGDYDNIVQDSLKFTNSKVVIIFWEICNLVDGLHFKIQLYNDDEFNRILERTQLEIDLVLKNLQSTQLILFNKFTSSCFSKYDLTENKLDLLTNTLNKYLTEKLYKNVKLVDIEKILLVNSIEKSIDFRNYYSSKALYTINFFKTYTKFILPFIMSVNGKSKKILIFDCDNTLWKGILGEDGIANIEMSTKSKSGQIFNEIQNIALDLSRKGVLIGICSKNNLHDVQKVIETHPDIVLKDENITIKKINWIDKASNIKEIASELNIGIDSIVFVDDSSFEINLIKETLPEVTVLQVPEKLFEYPSMLRSKINLFYNLSHTNEDNNKVNMYKEQSERKIFENSFNNIEDYLTSLELNVTVNKNNSNITPRISQLTQKTNQFNLTTKRYTESEIEIFLQDNNTLIYTFSVADKFGDNGITGLCIVNINFLKQSADIDTFLMSCRVIGRNIELAFIDFLVEDLQNLNIRKIYSTFNKTSKNIQVENFYNKLSFNILNVEDKKTSYYLNIEDYNPNKLTYINIHYD